VQLEIEKRAHRFWFMNGCALSNALNDWLKAENEVLAEFAKTRTPRHPAQPARSETKTNTGGTPVLAAAIFHQPPVMSKLKSTNHCLSSKLMNWAIPNLKNENKSRLERNKQRKNIFYEPNTK